MIRVDLGSKARRETEVTPGIVKSTSGHGGVVASGDVAHSAYNSGPGTAGGVDKATPDGREKAACDVLLAPAYGGMAAGEDGITIIGTRDVP